MLYILSKLSNISTELALGCLKDKQSSWEKLSEQLASKGGCIETKTLDDIQQFYSGYVKDIDNAYPLDEAIKLS